MEDSAVTNFREYIRICTVQPSPDYAKAVVWLRKEAEALKAKCSVTEVVPGKPIVIMTVVGTNPDLPTILLNSHIDVVPVFPEYWKYDPFSAHKDEEGNIFGRGTQDMKSVGVQYIEAMKRFKEKKVPLLRTVHLSFVPDEEIGGEDGMKKFIQTEEFKALNVGFALDEGYASETDSFFVFYGERNIWQFLVKCPGSPGHASQLLPNTAGEKVAKIVDHFSKFRSEQLMRLQQNPSMSLGDVTSVNLTMLQGGVQFNVIPAELNVGFDMRIPPTTDLVAFESKLNDWCRQAGKGVHMVFEQKNMSQCVTSVQKGENVWWDAFKSACDKEKLSLNVQIFPAGTDARFIRECGIPALGFSPMNRTPLLLHDHNEFLNENVFLRGIQIYESIIGSIANLSE